MPDKQLNKNDTPTKDYRKVLKLSIILCWIMLLICFVIKIFGGNFFEIAVTDDNFIKICEFIDKYLLIPIQFIFYTLNSWVYFSASYGNLKPRKKTVLLTLLAIVILFVLKVFVPIVGSILEIVVMFLFPILLEKVKWYWSLIYVIIYYAFTFVSVFIKNIMGYNLPNTTLIGVIFSLDIFFMLMLFMLYNNKNGR